MQMIRQKKNNKIKLGLKNFQNMKNEEKDRYKNYGGQGQQSEQQEAPKDEEMGQGATNLEDDNYAEI